MRILERDDEGVETPIKSKENVALRIEKNVRSYFDGKLFAWKLGRACEVRQYVVQEAVVR